jgi:hypothetical protein
MRTIFLIYRCIPIPNIFNLLRYTMKTLALQIAQNSVWSKWVAANSVQTDGCVSGAKDGCVSAAKAGCVSAAMAKPLPKTGCVS